MTGVVPLVLWKAPCAYSGLWALYAVQLVLLTVLNVCTRPATVFEVIFLTHWKCAFAFQCGDTPLHNALESGHKAVAELLLDRGASVTAVANVGHCTALFCPGTLPVV